MHHQRETNSFDKQTVIKQSRFYLPLTETELLKNIPHTRYAFELRVNSLFQIRVNSLNPGLVMTELAKRVGWGNPVQSAKLISKIPLGHTAGE